MKLDRYMVTLFFEIRRNMPIEMQREMKISAPDLGNVMVNLHKTTNDENIRLLVEVFLDRAGPDWLAKTLVKENFYRGLKVTSKSSRPTTTKNRKKKPVRYYRGVRVDD